MTGADHGGAGGPEAIRLPGGGRPGRGQARAALLLPLLAVLAAACGPAAPRRPVAPSPHAGPPLTTVAAPCTGVSLYPSPGTPTASPTTQLSFRGLAPGRLETAPVSVIGSRSGRHAGRWVADSDGRGASLYPATPFAAGETVTVLTSLRLCGVSGGRAQFTIARPPPKLHLFPSSAAPGPSAHLRTFRSAPDLRPPAIPVTTHGPTAPGDLFLAPKNGEGLGGPMILGPTGHLIWFDPLRGTKASDFRTQRYRGAPVLTWWQGVVISGHGVGEDLIANQHYQVIATIHAGNGYHADLHEFRIVGSVAWITAFNPVAWNLASAGGPADGAVWDGIVEAIDIPTGNVLFEWHSLAHVAPRSSVAPLPTVAGAPYDYFHVNSIDPQPDGTVLISSRNTDCAYEVNQTTGRVLWRLGGPSSSFRMGPGTVFRLQHDVQWRGDGIVTVFDDEDQPPDRLPARGLVLRLNLATRRVTLVHAYGHTPPLLDSAQGNVQLLPDGHLFIGWGSAPYISEVTRGGRVVLSARLPAGDSYRAYRAPWTGLPLTRPQLTVVRRAGTVALFASWNGATLVRRWVALAGPSPARLRPVGSRSATSFQTRLSVHPSPAYVAVRAEGTGGVALATSAAVKVAAG